MSLFFSPHAIEPGLDFVQARGRFTRNTNPYFGSGCGSTVLIPGTIVDVALNFR